MAEKYARELTRETERVEKLLGNVMPRSVEDELKDDGATTLQRSSEASVLMVEALADGRSAADMEAAIDGAFAIAGFIDEGLKQQAAFNLEAHERAVRRRFDTDDREAMVAQQHRALRWTSIGSAMVHPQFRATPGRISPAGLARFDPAAPAFQ